jgi:glycosyltransferase involved in cell wall biosynthesis
VVVGDGPDAAELSQLAEALGVASRLHMIGRVGHAEVAAYASGFDVALQTAAPAYASPLKLFEYLGLGLPVVAPDQPNIREVLADSENALLFRPGDQAAFQVALERICADAGLRARLGAAGRRTVEQRPFTWAHNAERVAALAGALAAAAEDAPAPVRPVREERVPS